jgi:hypothetical protein
MELKPVFLDLKILFLGLLGAGAWLGDSRPEWHWRITCAFAVLALLYVSHHPYKNDADKRIWFLQYKWQKITAPPTEAK